MTGHPVDLWVAFRREQFTVAEVAEVTGLAESEVTDRLIVLQGERLVREVSPGRFGWVIE
jgi:hypothetical protein